MKKRFLSMKQGNLIHNIIRYPIIGMACILAILVWVFKELHNFVKGLSLKWGNYILKYVK